MEINEEMETVLGMNPCQTEFNDGFEDRAPLSKRGKNRGKRVLN
jgi:hypothetical protein